VYGPAQGVYGPAQGVTVPLPLPQRFPTRGWGGCVLPVQSLPAPG